MMLGKAFNLNLVGIHKLLKRNSIYIVLKKKHIFYIKFTLTKKYSCKKLYKSQTVKHLVLTYCYKNCQIKKI